MKRRRNPNANRHENTRAISSVLESIRRAPIDAPIDDSDADLPGVVVEEVRFEGSEFWSAWRRVQRAAAHRVPLMLTRRRRSKWLIVLAGEDLFALFAAIRAVEDDPR